MLIEKDSLPLADTKHHSVIDGKSEQLDINPSEPTEEATPIESSQILVHNNTNTHIPSADSKCRQSSSSPHNAEIMNGLEVVGGQQMEELNSSGVLHGKPVSVICSTLDDRNKSDSTNKPVDDRSIHSQFVDISRHLGANATEDNVGLRLSTTDDNSANCQPSKASICSNSHDITNALSSKYDGPSRHQLTAVDHEPTENGSSTSTDSGVVAGSPKSDICATPPAG